MKPHVQSVAFDFIKSMRKMSERINTRMRPIIRFIQGAWVYMMADKHERAILKYHSSNRCNSSYGLTSQSFALEYDFLKNPPEFKIEAVHTNGPNSNYELVARAGIRHKPRCSLGRSYMVFDNEADYEAAKAVIAIMQ